MKQHTDIALVINMSGGKDSVRMLGYLCEKYPSVKKFAVYADTGFEHVKPVTAEAWSRERCAQFGVELHVVRNPNKTYLEMVERRKMFPSSTTRQCTSDLKRDPINTWIRRAMKSGLITEKIVVSCVGIRASESSARSKAKPLKKNARLSKAGRIVWDWLPIFRLSLEDVLGWHRSTETPFHPVYTYAGGYLKRFSCRVCIFSTTADLQAIYKNDRESFDQVSNLETKIGFTMRSGQSLIQIVSAPLPTGAKQYGEEELAETSCAVVE